ncbi:expressed unknown protein [Seminavis robusta]|uniref:BZIP domain-containing protein n=1 Tax=Seminavis robusta TaxID=568900 RepID=A0A9N8HK32_9STRA|nr:expressed unknown protein [Seminavis robusta]|eukprot:Sro589_g171710.1 n/a (178) ;mRNA; f:20091-20701
MTAEANGNVEVETGEEKDGADSEEVKNRKRRERLEQNRVSARESRKRKKSMIEELQRTVITLSRENKELSDRNEHLKQQLMELGSKYPSIVPLQAIMQGAAASAPTAPGADLYVPAAAAVPVAAPQPAAAVPVPAAPGMVAFNPMQFWPQQAAATPQAPAPTPVAQPAPAPGHTQNA